MAMNPSYRRYLTDRFGSPVLKIPLNAGFSCPNRDGTISSTGCAFCDNRSFSPVAGSQSPPLSQLCHSIERARGKFRCFLPYLQPFSNTYADVSTLQEIYEPLLEPEGVVGLAIGTRPDCFSHGVFDYLRQLASRTYLSVELGLQSAHDSTLRLVNRGHSRRDFEMAVTRLASDGVEVAAHVILGLPGETEAMMMETAKVLAGLPVHGVKLHQLMIIEGTALHGLFEAGELMPMSLERYAESVASFISHLRPDQCIHRLMADSRPEHGLVAPMWSGDKAGSLRVIHRTVSSS